MEDINQKIENGVKRTLRQRIDKNSVLYMIIVILTSSGVGFGGGLLGGNQALESKVMELEIHFKYLKDELKELKNDTKDDISELKNEIKNLIKEVKKN